MNAGGVEMALQQRHHRIAGVVEAAIVLPGDAAENSPTVSIDTGTIARSPNMRSSRLRKRISVLPGSGCNVCCGVKAEVSPVSRHVRNCERSGDGQGFGNWSGDGIPKANLQAHRRAPPLMVGANEKTCLFPTKSFEIVWEFRWRRKNQNRRRVRLCWWARQDSNLQPDRYERPALTIELQAPPRAIRSRANRQRCQHPLQRSPRSGNAGLAIPVSC